MAYHTPTRMIIVGALERCQKCVDPVVQALDHLGIGSRLFAAARLPELVPDMMRMIEGERSPEAILVSPMGNEVCIAANKFQSIRAVVAHDTFEAQQSRTRLGCNVLCLPVELLSGPQVREIVEAWCTTDHDHHSPPRPLNDIQRIEHPPDQ